MRSLVAPGFYNGINAAIDRGFPEIERGGIATTLTNRAIMLLCLNNDQSIGYRTFPTIDPAGGREGWRN
jgi:hypothetical protein